MRIGWILPILLLLGVPAHAGESLFKQLSETSTSDQQALKTLLSTERLSASKGVVVEGNRLNGGAIRHGVPAEEIAAQLKGCSVTAWRDVGGEQGSAFILWECPNQRVPENGCYFYSYRAEMLDPRFHPANFFVHGTPTWDARCGVRIVAPPKL